jgi:hypothetical protein
MERIATTCGEFKPYPDLFGNLPPQPYPASPGFKSGGTSQEAARAIERSASKVRDTALKEFQAAGAHGLTPDECAKLLGHSVLYIRPRCTELKKLGLIEALPERRKNESGMVATVLRAVEVRS